MRLHGSLALLVGTMLASAPAAHGQEPGASMPSPPQVPAPDVSVPSVPAPDVGLPGLPSPADKAQQPFSPRLRVIVETPGHVQRGDHPALRTIITQDPGETPMRSSRVTLPTQLKPNVHAVSRTCSLARLEAHTCPRSSRIGAADVSTALVPGGLHGPVLLANTGGAPAGTSGIGLPFAVIRLQGGGLDMRLDGAQRFLPTYRLQTTFGGLPPVPVSRFALSFLGGSGGPLTASRSLCVTPPGPVDARFVAQDGRVVNVSQPVEVPACARLPRISAAYHDYVAHPNGRVTLRRGTRGPRLRSAEIRLPAPLDLVSTRRLTVRVDGREVSARRWSIRGDRLRVIAPGGSASRIEVVYHSSTLRQRHSPRWYGDRRRLVAVTRARITDVTGKVTSYRLRTRAER